jgi:cell division septation protein DedD
MRIFTILLLLANLAYFGWHWYSPSREPVTANPPLHQAPRTLTLLSEVAPGSGPEPAIPATEEEPQTCLSLGVFDNTDESDFLVSALQARGMEASAEMLQSGVATSYRVYMPPFNADTAARQTLEELQDRDIESFLITSGDLAGGISLGLFTQKDRALALQESLASQGFASSIQELETPRNELWVTIRGLSQDLLEGSDLLDLLSDGLDLEVIEKPCETLVSRP